MGLFDIFDAIVDIGGDIVSLPFKIAGAAIELGSDIGETTATGDSRTSYSIRDEAEKIIKESQNDLDEASRDLWNLWWDVSDKAKNVAQTRSEVYGLVKLEIHDVSITELPSMSQASSGNIYAAPSLDDFSFNFGTALGVLGIGERREAAEEYLRKANRYQAKVADRIVEYKQLEQAVRNISNCQEEELKMLNIIRQTYKTKSQSVLAETEDGLRKLAELCNQHLSEATDRSYGELLQKLKSLWM